MREFDAAVIEPLRVNPSTSGLLLTRLLLGNDSNHGFSSGAAYTIACAYVAEAKVKISRDHHQRTAWPYVSKALFWTGMAMQSESSLGTASTAEQLAKEWGRQAAIASHREHHAMKAQVIQWCIENHSAHRSVDSMAEAVAGKLVPVKFRTAQAWIGKWKKAQAAGTP